MLSTKKLQALFWKYIFISVLAVQPVTRGYMSFIGIPANFMFDKWPYFGFIGWKYSCYKYPSVRIDEDDMDGIIDLPTCSIMVKPGIKIWWYE